MPAASGIVEVFGNSEKMRGCFHRFNIMVSSDSFGARLILPAAVDLPQAMTPFEPMVVVGIEFAEKEKFHIVQCFEDTNYVYAFGHDPTSSIIRVSYVAFMIDQTGTTHSQAMNRFIDAYKDNRISKSLALATLSLGGANLLQGFIISMSAGTADAQYNLQNFVIEMLAVKPYGS